MSSTEDVREFENALVSIKGNAMRCGNSVFSITNIVSLTFDAVRKDRPKPESIAKNFKRSKFFFKLFLFSCLLIALVFGWEIGSQDTMQTVLLTFKTEFNLSDSDIRDFFSLLFLSAPFFLLVSVIFSIVAIIIRANYVDHYYVHGLRVIFVNNMSLYFRASRDTGFIKETINGLEYFMSNPNAAGTSTMVVNFSDRSVNIEKVENSNVVGGDVQGGVING